jgi:PhzF family phenazine biosynthesis protein
MLPSTLPLYQVDAFSERPFAGNPAAVCPLEAPIPDALMQDIAAENNLSETAFFSPQDDAFSLRWFTPTTEVDLCGHATLASAFVLMTELEPARGEVMFRTRSGLLPVRREAGGTFVMALPAWPAAGPADAATGDAVARAIGVVPREVVRARSLFAVLDDAAAVRAVTPDFAALAALPTSLGVTAPGAGETRPVDFVSRYFAPGFGVPEDPVTGSAHCTLAPLWAARLGKTSLRARQVSRRGGELSCELAGDRVLIGGKACLVIKGTLRV